MQQQSDSTALLFWIKACNKPQEALIRKALLLFLCLFLGVCGGGETLFVSSISWWLKVEPKSDWCSTCVITSSSTAARRNLFRLNLPSVPTAYLTLHPPSSNFLVLLLLPPPANSPLLLHPESPKNNHPVVSLLPTTLPLPVRWSASLALGTWFFKGDQKRRRTPIALRTNNDRRTRSWKHCTQLCLTLAWKEGKCGKGESCLERRRGGRLFAELEPKKDKRVQLVLSSAFCLEPVRTVRLTSS